MDEVVDVSQGFHRIYLYPWQVFWSYQYTLSLVPGEVFCAVDVSFE